MKKATLIFSIIILSTTAPAQYLHTRGQKIVDGNDNPVLLRGIGLGGWLMPEGYMLHIPGYGSPTSIRTMIEDLIGTNATDAFFRRYRANYVTEEDIELIARWGFNSIRLPFHYEILSPKDQPGVYLEEGFAVLDSMLAWCGRNGLYLILDMHAAPGGQNPHNISDSDGTARLWTEPANQDRTVEIWKTIAARYADEPWIGGYDLLNEPVLPNGYSNGVLAGLYRRIATAIREVDANHIIFIEGNWFATDFTNLTPPILYGPNVAYSFHKYWNEPSQASIQDYINLRQNWNVPLWLGESGENSNTWFHATVQLMEQQNIGWCWWTHKKVATITSPLSSPMLPDYQRVLDYWNGSADRPSQSFAQNALWNMADNLALNRCELHPDVLAALFDPDFGTQSKAFVDHPIPDLIDAVDYDLGDNSIAYLDSKVSRNRFDDAEPWNSGWSYRNDGVDIEPSRDDQGAPFAVGWIDAGEWLQYTVDVAPAGIYSVAFRISSPDGGGGLELSLDGAILTPEVRIPRTGGWYTWTWMQGPDVTLPAGKHLLRVQFTRPGFNINQMRFELKQATEVEERQGQAQSFRLQQNYPNPFNSSTTINYALPISSDVDLTIFDLTGKLVRVLVDDRVPAGNHTAVWDGRDALGNPVASGAYLYKLKAGPFVGVRKIALLR